MNSKPQTVSWRIRLGCLLSLLLAPMTLQAVDSRNVHIADKEIFGFGDFDENGLLDTLVVDRDSGAFRIGYGQADGSLAWSASRPSGMADVDSLTVGSLVGATDGFAVCGGSANRVHVIVPGDERRIVDPTVVFPSGLEPVSVTALPIDFGSGELLPHSLVVEGAWSPDPRRNVIQNAPGDFVERIDEAGVGTVFRGARVLFDPGEPEGYGSLIRLPASDTFVLAAAGDEPDLPPLDALRALPPGSEFLQGTFDSRRYLVLYQPGDAAIRFARIEEQGELVPPVAYPVASPISSVFLVRPDASDQLLILFADGSVRLFAFDGTDLRAGQSLPVPTAGRITAGLGYADGALVLLTASNQSGVSDGFQRYAFQGGSWIPVESGNLPASGSAAAASNILFYSSNPLLDENAVLIKMLRVPDWTSDIELPVSSAVEVFVEGFQGTLPGLGNGSLLSLGPRPAGATHALTNQFRDDASIAGGDAAAGSALPSIVADPPGGVYDETIAIRLITKDPLATAYFRIEGSGDPAVVLPPLGTISPPGGTLTSFEIVYYAELPDGTRSRIHRAQYSFAGDPGEVDSDNDGVPDFVEGDPHGGPDTDGDTFSDFEELVLGTDADDPASRPDPGDRPAFDSAFDVAIRPLSVGTDGTLFPPIGDPGLGEPTTVKIHSPSGSLLGQAVTSDTAPGKLPSPLAMVREVSAQGGAFLVASTPARFDVTETTENADGREVLGLVPVPEVSELTIAYQYGGQSQTAERAAWIAAAQAAYGGGNLPLLSQEITFLDSLALLVMERFLMREFDRRDPGNGDIATLSLTGHRDVAPPAFTLTGERLRSLQLPGANQEPAFLLQEVLAQIRSDLVKPSSPSVQALIALARELHRVSAALSDTEPGLYPSAFDTLRGVVRADDLSTPAVEPFELPGATPPPGTSYAAQINLSSTELTQAAGGVAELLGTIQARQAVTLDLLVVSTSYQEDSQIVLEETTAPHRYRLFTREGRPYPLPSQFRLPIGTELRVTGYLDGAFPPGDGTGIEVLTAAVVEIGIAGTADEDGNLLSDDFEEEYFGGTGADPFGDPDGDGYSTLQESLEGTSPLDPGDVPSVAAEDLRPPEPEISLAAGGVDIAFPFPARYDSRIIFRLEETGNLLGFGDTGQVAQRALGILHLLAPMDPADVRAFYRIVMALR